MKHEYKKENGWEEIFDLSVSLVKIGIYDKPVVYDSIGTQYAIQMHYEMPKITSYEREPFVKPYKPV